MNDKQKLIEILAKRLKDVLEKRKRIDIINMFEGVDIEIPKELYIPRLSRHSIFLSDQPDLSDQPIELKIEKRKIRTEREIIEEICTNSDKKIHRDIASETVGVNYISPYPIPSKSPKGDHNNE